MDLKAIERRYPHTVFLSRGEHHSQDVTALVQADEDVHALLSTLRAARKALRDVQLAAMEPGSERAWRLEAINHAADVLASCSDLE